jgi:hypothetical protein
MQETLKKKIKIFLGKYLMRDLKSLKSMKMKRKRKKAKIDLLIEI